MKELLSIIPDPDILLALEPEELGAKMLFLLQARSEPFSLDSFAFEVRNSVGSSRGLPAYSQERQSEVTLAVSEAFAWLVAQGLIVPKPGEIHGWMLLSRRAQRFATEEDFRQFEMARRLNRDLLHPLIAEEVWLSFVRGRFAAAVFEAMRAVEIAVRETGFE